LIRELNALPTKEFITIYSIIKYNFRCFWTAGVYPNGVWRGTKDPGLQAGEEVAGIFT
jgi:hypothetical protein